MERLDPYPTSAFHMKSLPALVVLLLTGCSTYGSIQEMRDAPPQKTVQIHQSLVKTYHDLVTAAHDCYRGGDFSFHSIQYPQSAEVIWLAQNGVTFGFTLEELSSSVTEVNLYWGYAVWQDDAEETVRAVNAGTSADC